MTVLERIAASGLVPVVRVDRAADAPDLARTLAGAGLACIEITFRTDAAVDSIRAIRAEVPGTDGSAGSYDRLEPDAYAALLAATARRFPNLRAIAVTLRVVRTASRNDWGALLWADGTVHAATTRTDLEILDRIGGGDSFVSGLIHGYLAGHPPALAVKYGAVHGALAMTTPGDTSMATQAEVEALVAGVVARVRR